MIQVDSDNVKGTVQWTPVLDIAGKRYPITKSRTIIGRGSDADVVVDDTGISRKHVEILWDGSRAEVNDLGSTNGSQLNGAPVKRAPLPPDSVISIGRTRIVFRVLAQSSSIDQFSDLRVDPPTATTVVAGERTDAAAPEIRVPPPSLGIRLRRRLRPPLRPLRPAGAADAHRRARRHRPSRRAPAAMPCPRAERAARRRRAPAGTRRGATSSDREATRHHLRSQSRAWSCPSPSEPLTIGRSSESGLVIRDDYTSTHHARLLLWGEDWVHAGPRLHQRHLPRRRARHRPHPRSP